MRKIIFIDDDKSEIEGFILACKDIQGKKVKYFSNTGDETKKFILKHNQTIDLVLLDIMFEGDGENYYGGYQEGVIFYKSFLKSIDNLLTIIFTNKIPENYREDFKKHCVNHSEIEVIEKAEITIDDFKQKIESLALFERESYNNTK